jgi:5'-nucleotidase
MPLASPRAPDWTAIDTVLLDLDGTLLDLAFDNYIWRECVPQAYALARGLDIETARTRLISLFRAREGTLDWYCIEYWGRTLGLDIAAIHREQRQRIAWLPGAPEFLRGLRSRVKRVVLATNAHPQTLQIKDQQAGVASYFDALYSSHQFGFPKEHAQFWQSLQKAEPYDPRRTLFIDDSLPVLRAARQAGIQWVYAVGATTEFPTLRSVAELPL